jgi:hypothetical protein
MRHAILAAGLLTVWLATGFAQDIGFTRPKAVSIRRLQSKDLTYLLNHIEIVAEAPLPHLQPEGRKFGYRIMGVGAQGNCVGGCPPTTVFVTISDYMAHRDGRLRLFRIDGVRFWRFGRVEEFKTQETNGYFLAFTFASVPVPNSPQWYRARIGYTGATVERMPR